MADIPTIQLKDVGKIYKMGETEVVALQNVNLNIAQGEYVAVMGASGSGKSTLMNILGFLDRPTTGQYLLEGVDVSRLDRDRRAEIRNDRVGFVFQNFNLLARTSALENVELPLLYSKKNTMSDEELEKHVRRCLARVGLEGREHHTPSQLSGGQQQRVAIARALVNDPSILLADEPTGNLDTKTSEEILSVFRNLNEEGRTVILITHEMDIAKYARRVVTFRDGQIISDHAAEFEARVS